MCRIGPHDVNIIALQNYKCSLREHGVNIVTKIRIGITYL